MFLSSNVTGELCIPKQLFTEKYAGLSDRERIAYAYLMEKALNEKQDGDTLTTICSNKELYDFFNASANVGFTITRNLAKYGLIETETERNHGEKTVRHIRIYEV